MRAASLFLIAALSCAGIAQNSSSKPSKDVPHSCPMMDQQRADEGMGFSQTKTTHHFKLTKDGGSIEVDANDAADHESRDEIRLHLRHVAQAFAKGDFAIPMFVHDQIPDGVPVMKAKKDRIDYHFEETQAGGRVLISSTDAEALSAIHEFLAFQIREHKTGDPGTGQ